jgi:hypothetical protein
VAVVKDFTGYEYSTASFYEKGIKNYEKLVSIHDTLFKEIPGSPCKLPQKQYSLEVDKNF